MEPIKILAVYDDEFKLEAMLQFLKSKGYCAYGAVSVADAENYLKSENIELLISDQRFAEDTDDTTYQQIKFMNPMILVTKVNIDSQITKYTGSIAKIQAFEYFQRMLGILDVIDSTRFISYAGRVQ